VLQQALLPIVESIFRQGFDPSGYGYRPNHSSQMAVAKADLIQGHGQLAFGMNLSRGFDTLQCSREGIRLKDEKEIYNPKPMW